MIIGLSGYAGSGKSASAEILHARCGFKRARFAAPLKDMLRSLLASQGLAPSQIERMVEGDLKEVSSVYLGGKTPRYAMQTLGTDWGRALICEDLWCSAARRGVNGDTVFEDVRFDNEVAAVRSAGGLVVRITRPGIGPVNAHVSECLPDCDMEVVNDGTLMDLESNLYQLTVASDHGNY